MIKTFAALAALALRRGSRGCGAGLPAREIRAVCNYAAVGADLIVRFYSDQLSRLAASGDRREQARRAGHGGQRVRRQVPARRADDPDHAGPLHVNLRRRSSGSCRTTRRRISPPSPPRHGLVHPGGRREEPIHSIQSGGASEGAAQAGLLRRDQQRRRHLRRAVQVDGRLDTTYVPYKANPNALADLLAGQLDFIAFDST